jgi:hypothetical protein
MIAEIKDIVGMISGVVALLSGILKLSKDWANYRKENVRQPRNKRLRSIGLVLVGTLLLSVFGYSAFWKKKTSKSQAEKPAIATTNTPTQPKASSREQPTTPTPEAVNRRLSHAVKLKEVSPSNQVNDSPGSIINQGSTVNAPQTIYNTPAPPPIPKLAVKSVECKLVSVTTCDITITNDVEMKPAALSVELDGPVRQIEYITSSAPGIQEIEHIESDKASSGGDNIIYYSQSRPIPAGGWIKIEVSGWNPVKVLSVKYESEQ